MQSPPESIAVFRLSALGDVVLTIPMIRALQNAYPKCRITWITSTVTYPLLKGLEGINFLVINKPNNLKDYLALKKLFKNYQFDILIAAQASLRANLIYPLIKAKRKIGFDNTRARDFHSLFVHEQIPYADQHLAEGFMGFASYLGISPKPISNYDWELKIDKADVDWAQSQRTKDILLIINPSASKKERSWKASHYAKLIDAAVETYNCQIILTGGPNDQELSLANDICSQATSSISNLTGETTHKQLAALLKEADTLIAPDTGPVHIAVAMGTPVVGLYAVARPNLSGPYQSPNYTVDKYPDAVEIFLNKSPTNAGWHERVHNSDAMDLISVHNVMDQLEKALTTKNQHANLLSSEPHSVEK